MGVLILLKSERQHINNPQRQQNFIVLIHHKLVDRVEIGVPKVERNVNFALDRVGTHDVHQVDALTIGDLHSKMGVDFQTIRIYDHHGLDIVVVLIVEQERDKSSSDGVAVVDEA